MSRTRFVLGGFEAVLQLPGQVVSQNSAVRHIFLKPPGSTDDMFLAPEVYVMEYEDTQSDTEEPAALIQLPDAEVEADVYRHHQARSPGRGTPQKRFDLDSMACVIAKLVMWTPSVNVFATYLTENLKNIIAIAKTSGELLELPTLADLFEREDAAAALRH